MCSTGLFVCWFVRSFVCLFVCVCVEMSVVITLFYRGHYTTSATFSMHMWLLFGFDWKDASYLDVIYLCLVVWVVLRAGWGHVLRATLLGPCHLELDGQRGLRIRVLWGRG